jgi:hypothetical protein
MTMPQLTKLVLCSDKSLSHTVAKNKDRMAKSSQNMSTFRRNLAHADRPLMAESSRSDPTSNRPVRGKAPSSGSRSVPFGSSDCLRCICKPVNLSVPVRSLCLVGKFLAADAGLVHQATLRHCKNGIAFLISTRKRSIIFAPAGACGIASR